MDVVTKNGKLSGAAILRCSAILTVSAAIGLLLFRTLSTSFPSSSVVRCGGDGGGPRWVALEDLERMMRVEGGGGIQELFDGSETKGERVSSLNT